jgi:glycosyltransferase involved in cell wall biosynthesis
MRIVLNMIVRNEARVIRRLLESCVDLIDTWVIVDTGSTDQTATLIESFFAEKGKPGFLRKRPFDDFGGSRTHAYRLCQELCPDAEWVVLLDADMVLKCPSVAAVRGILQGCGSDVIYHLFQGDNSFQTKNVRIIPNRLDISYWGTTHEYVDTPDNLTIQTIPTGVCCIWDVGDGGSKGNKAERDVRLLLKGLEDDPGNARYLFYLANTYADRCEWTKAIRTYERRIKAEGWFEEIWYSHYRMGEAWLSLGRPEKAVEAWLNAYDLMPERVESICQIVRLYREEGKNKLAHFFYRMGKESLLHDVDGTVLIPDVLFVNCSMYRYWLDYEQTIFGYYWNPEKKDIESVAMSLLALDDFVVQSGFVDNLLANYKWYSKGLQERGCVHSITLPVGLLEPGWNQSTPSVAHSADGSTVVLVRVVNYTVGDDGKYQCAETISTRNFLCLDYDVQGGQSDWIEVHHDHPELDNCYVGVEDMRIQVCPDGSLCFTGNRGLADGRMVVEKGVIDTESGVAKSVLLEYEAAAKCEKNWVLTGDGRVIHSWHPLVVGLTEENRFIKKEQRKTPAFFRFLRGSSHGVMVRGELWFLCHMVSHEDRRYYYHIFVVVDPTTLEVRRWSKLMTFTGEPVEYSCGFVVQEDRLLVGFSVMDRSSSLLSVPIDAIQFM